MCKSPDYTERARVARDRAWGLARARSLGHGIDEHELLRALNEEIANALSAVASEHQATPIPMVLFCPACGVQHIDKTNWDSPPHRTHQCQGCGGLWRPAAVYTEGVADVPLGTSDARPAIRERADYRAALLARLQEPDVREAVIQAIAPVARNTHRAAESADAALTKIAEMLK